MEKRAKRSILITGPESTGKSEISKALATIFKGKLLPEYAREYLETHGSAYTSTIVEEIAKEQLKRRNALLSIADSVVFFDTDLLVCRIWMEHVYGTCPDWIIKESMNPIFTHILLMDIDLPWQEDPLREHPHQRKELFEKYHQALLDSGRDFSIVRGVGNARIEHAIEILKPIIEA